MQPSRKKHLWPLQSQEKDWKLIVVSSYAMELINEGINIRTHVKGAWIGKSCSVKHQRNSANLR